MRRAQRRALLGNYTNDCEEMKTYGNESGLSRELASDRFQDVDSKPLPAGSEIRLCKHTAILWL